jgi:hypothetical protein
MSEPSFEFHLAGDGTEPLLQQVVVRRDGQQTKIAGPFGNRQSYLAQRAYGAVLSLAKAKSGDGVFSGRVLIASAKGPSCVLTGC